jgi:pseudouridine kinase
VSSTGHGGVGRNVAENLARLGHGAALVSVVGDDEAGRELVAHLQALDVEVSGVRVSSHARTAEYVAVLGPDHDLVIGTASMGILDSLDGEDVARALTMNPEGWLFADCNLSEPVLSDVRRKCGTTGRLLAVDAVSVPKVRRLRPRLDHVSLLFCNLDEARALLEVTTVLETTVLETTPHETTPHETTPHETTPHGTTPHDIEAARVAGRLLLCGCSAVVVTVGSDGAWVATDDGVTQVSAAVTDVVDVTGAGDALVAGTLAALNGRSPTHDELVSAVRFGVRIAAATVASSSSVYSGGALVR